MVKNLMARRQKTVEGQALQKVKNVSENYINYILF